MRRIALTPVIIATLLILSIQCPLISTAESDYNTFYFRDDIIPYLSKYPPEKEEGNITLDKTFVLENISSIHGGMDFDLYFKAPLFNLTGILELLLSILPVFSNVTIEMPKEKRTIKEVLENLSFPEWNITRPSVSQVGVISRINYCVQVEIGNISKTKTFEVCRLENISSSNSNLSLKSIFENLTEILTQLVGKESKVVHKEIHIEDVNVNISKDTLFVSIYCEDELLQDLAPIIETFQHTNESDLQTVVEQYLEINNMTKFKPLANMLVKFTKTLLNKVSKSVGFIYDSSKYPSSIRFQGEVTGSERFGAEKYYLKGIKLDGNYSLVLEKGEIETNNMLQREISSNTTFWELSKPFDQPTRILGNVTAHLYIKCEDGIEWYPVELSIYDKKGENLTKLASTTTKIFGYKYLEPAFIDIVLENVNHTFEKGHSLALGLRIVNRTIGVFGVELMFYRPKILFNSMEYPSYIQIITAPLDDIKLKFAEGTTTSPEIRRAGVARYNITITNRGETGDNLTLSLALYGELNQWPEGWRAVINLSGKTYTADFDWRSNVYIPGNSTINIPIEIYPSPDSPDGSEVEFRFSAKGTYRGSDSISDKIKIKIGSLGVNFVAIPENKKIEVGKTFNYTFRIKNTGNDVDDFTVNATSEHGWIEGDTSFIIEDLYPGNETEFSIVLKIPRNISSLPVEDNLIVQVKSKTDPKKGDEAWVVTTAVELSIFDKINEFFGGMTNSLKGQFGEAASLIALAVLLAIALIIILSLIYVFTRKYAELICIDRIKEISPGGEARFDITIKNPSKMRLSYDAYVDKDIIPEGWDVKISESEFRLDPGEERKVSIFVKATENIDPDGFAKIRLFVIPKEKSKTYYMDLIVTSKNATVDLKIENVSHLPRTFKSGDTVTTKFILRNKGTVRAKNVRVSLRVNGEEVNSADIEEIPPEGYAEIEMPWIAYPGRNDISIVAEM